VLFQWGRGRGGQCPQILSSGRISLLKILFEKKQQNLGLEVPIIRIFRGKTETHNTNFLFHLYKILSRMSPILRECSGEVEILNTHYHFCRKFAAVCWKITSCLESFKAMTSLVFSCVTMYILQWLDSIVTNWIVWHMMVWVNVLWLIKLSVYSDSCLFRIFYLNSFVQAIKQN